MASYPTNGDDYIVGTPNDDTIDALAGNDILFGQAGNDILNGGEGRDFLYGREGNDILNGDAGNDYLTGGTGNDIYFINSGDFISELANEGTDTAYSSVSLSMTFGLENLIFTGSSSINGTGNSLNNVIKGNAANNILDGGNGGNDRITGGSGSDTLVGRDGNDTLIGGSGSDQLFSDAGDDVLTGSTEVDRFWYTDYRAFATVNVGKDRITDFSGANAVGGDVIVLDKTMFTSLNSVAGAGFSVAGEFMTVTSDAAAATSSGEIVYNSANDKLFYNQNGIASGFGTGDLFATLTGISSLAAGDFLIQT